MPTDSCISPERPLQTIFTGYGLVGRSPLLVRALKLTAKVAPKNSTVLLQGESGTGKELLAKAIHGLSPRSHRPFVALNCSAFPDTLIESELFGYEKGAFTGAERAKPGKIRQADGGTLFLDEVTELSPLAQTKLLRVLQERQLEPLGSLKSVEVDIRVIAAANKNLEERVEEKRFREDLYYRLYVFPIFLPPLRERGDDLWELTQYFIGKFNYEMRCGILDISSGVREIFENHFWPGNVRELQNVLECAMVLARGRWIDVDDIPQYLVSDPQSPPRNLKDQGFTPEGFKLEQYVGHFEASVIIKVMKQCGFNQIQTAKVLGLAPSTFRYKLGRVKKNYRPYFCENFLTAFCKPCQEQLPNGKTCAPIMDDFFSRKPLRGKQNLDPKSPLGRKKP